MKKLFTFVVLLVVTSGFSQANDVYEFKSESYIINGTPFLGPETVFSISESDMNIKPLGNVQILNKAVSVKNTSVYNCDYQGKKVEVITVITPEKLKVTVRGQGIKHVIEADLIDPKKLEEEFSKSTLSAN